MQASYELQKLFRTGGGLKAHDEARPDDSRLEVSTITNATDVPKAEPVIGEYDIDVGQT